MNGSIVGLSQSEFCRRFRLMVLHPVVIWASIFMCTSVALLAPGGYLEGVALGYRLLINFVITAFFVSLTALALPQIIWAGLERNVPWIYTQILFYFPVAITTSIVAIFISGNPLTHSNLAFVYLNVQIQIVVASLLTLLALQNHIQKKLSGDGHVLPIWKASLPQDCGLHSHLPTELRGQILHLKAENQYVLIKTDKGEQLVRMSLTKAISLLPEGLGIRTHRSHWIHLDQMVGLQFQNGNPKLLTNEGDLLPVSRNAVAAIREAID